MHMAMMRIRHVQMLVRQRGVFVRMRMRFGNHSFVSVLMVFVVKVKMLMK
jgi:hypothetical protein